MDNPRVSTAMHTILSADYPTRPHSASVSASVDSVFLCGTCRFSNISAVRHPPKLGPSRLLRPIFIRVPCLARNARVGVFLQLSSTYLIPRTRLLLRYIPTIAAYLERFLNDRIKRRRACDKFNKTLISHIREKWKEKKSLRTHNGSKDINKLCRAAFLFARKSRQV